jgi:PPM family protein phosphatase
MSRPSDRFAALQSQGSRDYQEDEFGILDDRDLDSSNGEHTLLVVADGMGGHTAGAKASQVATETFIDIYHNCSGSVPSRLRQGLEQSNRKLAEEVQEREELQGMGTTLLAVTVTRAGLHWISVGDSPFWVYRAGELLRINADHSMAPVLAEMVAAGKMTVAEAASDPKRNSLRAALMGDSLGLVDASDDAFLLQAGDLLILASDGVLTVSEEQIIAVIDKYSDQNNETKVNRLMAAVIDEGKVNQDNITLMMYSIESKTEDQDTVIPKPSAQRGH